MAEKDETSSAIPQTDASIAETGESIAKADESIAKADESIAKADESISTAAENFKFKYSRVGAWFLGPKAENKDKFIELATVALDKHSLWRRQHFPEDAPSITAEIQASADYENEMDKIKKELILLAKRLRNSVPFFSSRYKGHMTFDTSMIGSLAYFLTSLWNPNNVTTEGGNVTTFIEIEVGKQLCRMLGYAVENDDAESSSTDAKKDNQVFGWGHITSCGSIANIESLWAARSLKYLPHAIKEALSKESELERLKDSTKVILADGKTEKKLIDLEEWELLNIPADNILSVFENIVKAKNVDGAQRLIEKYDVSTTGMGSVKQGCYVIAATRHYSWDKAGALLGIGKKYMKIMPVDKMGRMKMAALRQELQECLDKKIPVLSVVAIIGTTAEGAVDPLEEMLTIREDFRKKGLDFYLHADGAWGGYMCSMFLPATRAFVPFLPMNDDVTKRLKLLKECDSITLDPHKSGYIQYPAGALCYRNGSTRYLLNFSATYLFSSSDDPSVGLFGIEGSKPGAAVAATYLHNKVVGLNCEGHGLLLGQANFTTKIQYCIINTLADDLDPFRVATYQELPDNVTKDQLRDILNLSNEEIYGEHNHMELLKEIGPDVLINCLVVNFRWPLMGVGEFESVWNKSTTVSNDVVAKMSTDLNISLLKPTISVTTPQGVARNKLYMIRNNLTHSHYSEVIESLQRRVDLNLEPNKDLSIMVSTNMDAWPTTTGFHEVFRHELRQSILRSIGAVMEKVHMHGFVVTDAGDYKVEETGEVYYEVFCDHSPVFSEPGHQYHLILKFRFKTKSDKQTWFYDLMTEPNKPVIYCNQTPIRVETMVRSSEPINMDVFVGLPSTDNKSMGQVKLQITDVLRYEHFEPRAEYPEKAEYFLYGNPQCAYLSHCPAKHPDYHNVVEVTRVPPLSSLTDQSMRLKQAEFRLEYGTPVTFTQVPGGPQASAPLKPFATHECRFIGDNGVMQTEHLTVGENVWFDHVHINAAEVHDK